MHFGSIACLAAVLSTFGCAKAATLASTSPTHAEVKPPEPHHVYRLDFIVASNDPTNQAGLPGGGLYTMNVEENRSAEIRSGSNIPLGSGSRIDVGTKIKAMYQPIGEDLLLNTSAEISAGDSGSIRKLTANGEAVLTPGKPALIASAEDPQGHARYQVTVTATKLR